MIMQQYYAIIKTQHRKGLKSSNCCKGTTITLLVTQVNRSKDLSGSHNRIS